MSRMKILRRTLLTATAACIALPALASSRRALAPMTDGPFYPPRNWRDRGPLAGDWDADLSRVQRGGTVLSAQGEHLGLQLQVADTQGRLLDGAEVEFWQCDAMAQYRHPNVRMAAGGYDPGFQGFGAARSAADGSLTLRTIKPVPYPGRTPHIHVKLRHATFGELTSQLFLAGDPGNARDFLWRAVAQADRAALELALQPAPADTGLRWVARHTLVVPA
jgi:protocatechuate 3,4-dioxygenase, beta subunit